MANIPSLRGATTSQAALIATALQAANTITRTIITRYGTTAERGGVTPQTGELFIDTTLNALYRGDGSTAGGIALVVSLNSPATVLVNPTAGTAILNGDLLRTAYAAAAALTPYGNALSTTNRARVVLMPGRYDIGGGASGLTLATEFVDIVGLCLNAEDVVIATSTTTGFIITQSANDCRLSNFTIYNTGNGAGCAMSNAAGHTATQHNNLFHAGDAANSVSSMSFSTFTNFAGTYKRCRSTRTRMYGGFANGNTCTAVFEDCEAYMGSLGCGSSLSGTATFAGRHTRCRLLAGGANGGILCINGALIEHGWYKASVGSQRVFRVTGATTPGPFFQYNTIISTSGIQSIDRNASETDGVLVASHNRMPALGISTNLTNGLGTAAASFNIEHASVTG